MKKIPEDDSENEVTIINTIYIPIRMLTPVIASSIFFLIVIY